MTMKHPFARHALALAACLCTHAWAQTTPNIGDALRQVPGTPPLDRPAATLPPVGGGTAIEPPMQALPAGGPSVAVKSFQIVGNREIDAATLLNQVSGDAGNPLTLTELEAIATRLTRYYRSQGYFVARVYVPQQEVKDGVVILRAVEGNYGRFILDNKSLVRSDTVQAMLDDVKKYDIVSLDTLERAMLIINDTPGAQVVRADVMPGEKVGTSDFAVGVAATPEHEGYLLLDNHGTRATGRERLSGNWNWNSPTGRGDQLSVSGLVSRGAGLVNGRVAYSTSLAPSGWRGEVALSHTEYSLGDTFANLDAQGHARSLEVGVTYPIRRISRQTVQAGLTYAHKALKDEIRSTATETPKRSDSLTASLLVRDEGLLWGLDGVTQGNLALTAGRLDIREATARAQDQAAGAANTHGGFSRLSASLGRVSLLPNQFSLAATLKLQRALGRNLDGSERMGIAGAGGVMAYPSGELSGSDAELLRLELSRPLPAAGGFKNQWSVLVNWGQARETDLQARRDLSDVAVGWVGKHTNGLLVKAYLAHRLSDAATSERASRNRLVLQGGWVF